MCLHFKWQAFPLDMSQFGNLLNSTRVPCQGQDVLSSDASARHTLVMKNGNFYVFDILDENGENITAEWILWLIDITAE